MQVNSTDLTATGVDRVLLDVVERLLFVPEADVVALALPCAASLLRAMNHNPARRPSPAHDALMAKVRHAPRRHLATDVDALARAYRRHSSS